jgi:hypothetical protein
VTPSWRGFSLARGTSNAAVGCLGGPPRASCRNNCNERVPGAPARSFRAGFSLSASPEPGTARRSLKRKVRQETSSASLHQPQAPSKRGSSFYNRNPLPHACGAVGNVCCDVSALSEAALKPSAVPLPAPKPAIACPHVLALLRVENDPP